MKKLIAIVLVSLTLAFASCNGGNHKHSVTTHPVKSYCQTVHNDDGTTALLYWYMMMNHSGHYYYYSSPTPVSNFSTVTWQTSDVSPVASFAATDVVAQPDIAVESSGFASDMQSTFTESNGFETTTSEVESATTESSPGTESSGFESSSESSSSSSESSSSGSDGGSSGSDGGGGGDGDGGRE